MSVDSLRNRWSVVTPIFFDLYDQAAPDHAAALEMLAYVHDNRTARESPVKLDWLLHLPVANNWLDEAVLEHGLENLEWTVPLEGHQVYTPIQRVDVGRPNVVATLEGIARAQPEALNRQELRLLMNVFRQNPLSVDGQAFFSTVHPKPGGGATYSNILEPVFGVGALESPSLSVLATLVNEVITTFGANLAIQAQVIDDAKLRNNLLVITHNNSHQTLFRELLTATRLPGATLPNGDVVGERENPVKGTFKLWRDNIPTAGQENYIEFVMVTPGTAARPCVYVIDRDPEPLVLDENRVRNGFYGVGFDKIFGVKPLVPSTAIQVRPLEEPA